MINEDGVDEGRTWGDLCREVGNAITRLGVNPSLEKIEGTDWIVYIDGGLIRCDINNYEGKAQ